MPTLYIDVYFLINFTVDYLSLYFASLLVNLKTSAIRLIVPSVLGGLLPCLLILFCVESIFYITIYVLWLIITAVICPRNASFLGCVKLLSAFAVIQTLFGGAITFLFEKLKNVIPYLSGEISTANSDMILLSCIIAIVFCLLKIFRIMLCSSIHKRTAKLKIKIVDTEFTVEGLIDSGSFLKDPMDLNPVIIIKEEILKQNIESLRVHSITDSRNPLSKKIRIIPLNSIAGNKILYGFKPDCIEIMLDKKCYSINSTVAIDTESVGFNECDAIIPLSAIV